MMLNLRRYFNLRSKKILSHYEARVDISAHIRKAVELAKENNIPQYRLREYLDQSFIECRCDLIVGE